ncbi:competence type IV pilus major pilin ComGC [Salinibacillus xinjiangensis]|uniref:Prepilin-type N-terminal cleavage/methylation domain-containing protein n=1 Tax=Salinibacillus xinjiangensis TaxID=1229268 RepID=A0A6G1X6P5_9BACI|nr:competence type IV pilus major pilin ComGC [Salinibacillus xinjiangensis]MRG86576.1 prepilin-type N-terminal cleavage/methylation domain-containing protein [Salinibacillus xinjiangensis]
MKNEKGFTLIEMLVVLMIISILLLITIPNVTKHNELIDTKGCEAYKEMVESQIQVYKIENGVNPTDLTQIDLDGNNPCNETIEITDFTASDVVDG